MSTHCQLWYAFIALSCAAGLAPSLAAAQEVAPDGRLVVLDAMQTELSRSANALSLPGYEPPYFVSYTLTDTQERSVQGRFGALYDGAGGRSRVFYVETRVGDYDTDNTNVGTFDFDPNQVNSPYVTSEAPLDDDVEALRRALWLLTDESYKEALSAYLRKQGKGVYTVEKTADQHVASFSRATPNTAIEEPIPFVFDAEALGAQARAASALLRAHPEVFEGGITISVRKQVRYYINTEGARLLTERLLYSVTAEAMTRADDGMLLENANTLYYPSASDLPDSEGLAAFMQSVIDGLLALRAAPVLEPYTGPAILAPGATGVLFHESIGHRLEGERQDRDEEGQTFKGQLGSAILPEFLSIIDDPTLQSYAGEHLNGHYRFDDEGVTAARTVLVEDGVLRNFLMSRSPVEGSYASNGHGRSAGVYDATARMGNLEVRSSRSVSDDELKQMLMAESQRQGKPYGLIIRDIEGGSTNTSSYGYQAFKGSPRMVYKVDAQTGEETLVRGVEMVGTPLTVIGKMMMASSTSEVFNGYCGAESGYVPVSTIAPAMLLSEIELQRSHSEPARPPILRSPLDKTVDPLPPQPKGRRSGRRGK